MQSLKLTVLDNPYLLECANLLPKVGVLKWDLLLPYCYLKIHDDFIHKLFPILFEDENKTNTGTNTKTKAIQGNNSLQRKETIGILQKPDYFSTLSNRSVTGAHISLSYPTEDRSQDIKSDLINGRIEKNHSFEVENLIKAELPTKTLFGLVVKAASLEKIRAQYGLGVMLNYNGLLVPFHITIAFGTVDIS